MVRSPDSFSVQELCTQYLDDERNYLKVREERREEAHKAEAKAHKAEAKAREEAHKAEAKAREEARKTEAEAEAEAEANQREKTHHLMNALLRDNATLHTRLQALEEQVKALQLERESLAGVC